MPRLQAGFDQSCADAIECDVLLWQAVSANSASRFVTLDFGEQPHRENHEKTEECNDVLNAMVPKHMLIIERNGSHQDNYQRKSEFNLYRHRQILLPVHARFAQDGPATLANVAIAIT